MLRVAPYIIAASAGMGLCVALAGTLPLSSIAQIFGLIGGLIGIFSAIAQKIESRLGELEKVEGLDRRIVARLDDRVRARRDRLVWKRAITLAAATVAGSLAVWSRSATGDELVSIALGASVSGAVSLTGAMLMIFESAALDTAVANLRRFTESASQAKAEAARLRAAATPAPQEAGKKPERKPRSPRRAPA